jgi:hypothetical protein
MSGMVDDDRDLRSRLARMLLLVIVLMSTIPMMVFLLFYLVAYFGAVTGLYNVERSLSGVRL